MAATWGAYIYVLNLIAFHTFVLVIIGRFTTKVFIYLFYIYVLNLIAFHTFVLVVIGRFTTKVLILFYILFCICFEFDCFSYFCSCCHWLFYY